MDRLKGALFGRGQEENKRGDGDALMQQADTFGLAGRLTAKQLGGFPKRLGAPAKNTMTGAWDPDAVGLDVLPKIESRPPGFDPYKAYGVRTRRGVK
jgi:hypothetical protein